MNPVVKPTQIVITEAEPNPPRMGEPVTLRGSNFGRAEGATVLIFGYGMMATLQVIEWKEDAVTATMPDDPRIRQDQTYFFRITRIKPREASNPFTFRFDKKIESQPIYPSMAAVVGPATRVTAPPSRAITPSAAAVAGAADEVAVPPFKAHITDLTGTLAANQLAALESDLRAFEQRKGTQIAVLMLPSTRPETIEQYSMRVAERWKIGRANIDDGVILIIAKDNNRLRIEVGYGLEGAIPDAIAKRVIDEVISPRFRANDFHGGIRDGVRTLMTLINGEKLPPPAGARRSILGMSPEWIMFLIFFLLPPVSIFMGQALSTVCGRLVGSAATGMAVGTAVWATMGTLLFAIFAGVVALVIASLPKAGGGGVSHAGGRLSSSGWSSGGGGGFSSSGSSSGSSSSGGGGSFGGGGASGSW